MFHEVKAKTLHVIDLDALNNQPWQVINDGVMGGLSRGTVSPESDSLHFFGQISTANNGGFSSAYFPYTTQSFYDAVRIKVKGDGKTYQLRLIKNENGYRVAYKTSFKTKMGKVQTHTLILSDFKASFRGRIISSAPPVYSNEIEQVGFLVTHKANSAFSLNVYQLEFGDFSDE
jgi:hypothetical protein